MDCESMPSKILRSAGASPQIPKILTWGAPSLAEYAYRARRTQLSCCSRGPAPADVPAAPHFGERSIGASEEPLKEGKQLPARNEPRADGRSPRASSSPPIPVLPAEDRGQHRS